MPADWPNLRSPEIYLGHDRGEGFASPGGARLGRRRVYKVPARLDLNHWAVDGEWTMKYFRRQGSRVWLESANAAYPPIVPEQELKIVAVVRAVVRKYA